MESFIATLTLSNFFTLGMLLMLQLVLGFDNLLYISLESKNAPPARQAYVRRMGIGMAIALRIALLFILVNIIKYFQAPIFSIHWEGYLVTEVNIHSIIVLVGGGFIIYTAMKEIWHMISLEAHAAENERKVKSVGQVITMIVVMNLVFSFDSILSAMALTDIFWVMATAIVIGGLLMIWLADRVASFLQQNRMYEVLGLFILFLVGVMLLSEGGHLAHLELFGSLVTPMSKTTFYFVIFVLVLTDIVQSRYQRKLSAEKMKKVLAKNEPTTTPS